ncbi:MAG: CdaR family protein [bacterium]
MTHLHIYRWIINNLWLKLSCFLLAVLLWFSTSGGVSIIRDFSIAITLENIPKNLIVSSLTTKNVFITVQGNRSVILKCQASAFYLPIDLSKSNKPGTYSYNLIPDEVYTPTGIKVISIEPRKVILALREKKK